MKNELNVESMIIVVFHGNGKGYLAYHDNKVETTFEEYCDWALNGFPEDIIKKLGISK